MHLTDMPPACSSAILRLVASGIGGRLVRLPCALARAMPAFARSPMSALSNWARLAIIPNTSSPAKSPGRAEAGLRGAAGLALRDPGGRLPAGSDRLRQRYRSSFLI